MAPAQSHLVVSSLRIVYLGSPPSAVAPLQALIGSRHEVLKVITRAPKRRRRNSEPEPTPVEQLATEAQIPVGYSVSEALGLSADLGVVVAYGAIIPGAVLDQLPMINIHFSLLPRWRGAAPVQRAMLAGDTETGVSLMKIDEGLDTGDVYETHQLLITEQHSAASLSLELADLGAGKLINLLDRFDAAQAKPQSGEATYASKITRSDLNIDWSQSATVAARQVAVGGAHTTVTTNLTSTAADRQDHHLIINAARALNRHHASAPPGIVLTPEPLVICGEGVLELLTVTPAGKRPVDATAWLRGRRGEVRLGNGDSLRAPSPTEGHSQTSGPGHIKSNERPS